MAETHSKAVGHRIVHLVEDDAAVRDAMSLMLATRGFRVCAHASADEFLRALGQAEPGCIVTDVQMPQMSGLQLLQRLRGLGIDWPAVVISGRATPPMGAEAAGLGATVLEKPFDPDELVERIGHASGPRR